MKSKKREERMVIEVFFNKSIERPYDGCDALAQDICKIAGFDKTPEKFHHGEWYNQFGEFGTGISAQDSFPASEAEVIYKKLLKYVGKKVGNDREIKDVKMYPLEQE